MMNKIIALAMLLFIMGCASKKASRSASKGEGHTRTKAVKMLDGSTYLLTDQSTDSTYGYSMNNPIKVGGLDKGPDNERKFLNALLGPKGESVSYYRQGSCCAFKTPHGFIDNMGMLDIYKVTIGDEEESIKIYINMYDKGDLYIPIGFTAKK